MKSYKIRIKKGTSYAEGDWIKVKCPPNITHRKYDNQSYSDLKTKSENKLRTDRWKKREPEMFSEGVRNAQRM